MNPQGNLAFFLPRVVMFMAMLVLIIFSTHFILPAPPDGGPDAIALNPAIQIGLFLTLTILGGLIGFWITFGDLINKTEKK